MEVHLPTALNVTAPVFGGPERDILFVTTGSLNESGDDQDPEKVKRYRHSGSVFAVRIPGVKGIDKHRFVALNSRMGT